MQTSERSPLQLLGMTQPFTKLVSTTLMQALEILESLVIEGSKDIDIRSKDAVRGRQGWAAGAGGWHKQQR